MFDRLHGLKQHYSSLQVDVLEFCGEVRQDGGIKPSEKTVSLRRLNIERDALRATCGVS